MKALHMFWSDRTGVAAVEFVLIFPVFLLLLVGTHEITNAAIAYKKTQKIAYTIDHLITKANGLTAASLNELTRSAAALVTPLDPSRVSIALRYIHVDEHGDADVAWVSQHNGGVPDGAQDSSLPAAYSALRDVGFLSTRVSYEHQASFPKLFFETLNLRAESIVRPRLGKPLECADC